MIQQPPEGIELKPRIIEILQHRFEHIRTFSGDPVQLVKYIYKTADIIYKEQIKPAAVCPSSGGCSHCCRVPVQVTVLEAFYIKEKTGAKIKDLTQISMHEPDNSKCPFLKNDMCSVYEFRPLNCRVFASMDSVSFCAAGGKVKHWISKVDSSPPLVFLSNVLMSASTETPYATFADVRHWFGPEKINVKQL